MKARRPPQFTPSDLLIWPTPAEWRDDNAGRIRACPVRSVPCLRPRASEFPRGTLYHVLQGIIVGMTVMPIAA